MQGRGEARIKPPGLYNSKVASDRPETAQKKKKNVRLELFWVKMFSESFQEQVFCISR